MIFSVSPFEKPRLRRKFCRSSASRATMAARDALIPSRNDPGEDDAKRSRAGEAPCANSQAANLLWRMLLYSKPSGTTILRFMQTEIGRGTGMERGVESG